MRHSPAAIALTVRSAPTWPLLETVVSRVGRLAGDLVIQLAERRVFAPDSGHLDSDKQDDERDERDKHELGHRLPFARSAKSAGSLLHAL